MVRRSTPVGKACGLLALCMLLAGCHAGSAPAPPTTPEQRKAQLDQQIGKINADANRTAEQKARDTEILRSLAAESQVGRTAAQAK